jgi:SEC-C motif-containing protein
MTEMVPSTNATPENVDAIRAEFAPYFSGEKQAQTAEELMRSRYAAYVCGNVDYIISTHHPDKQHEIDRANTELWAKQSQWLGFEITKTEQGGPEDTQGVVEFVARYKLKGATFTHREHSEFEKINGKWYFVDGEEISGPPVRVEKLPGRNDPCTCGSGKKFKKCCGRAA